MRFRLALVLVAAAGCLSSTPERNLVAPMSAAMDEQLVVRLVGMAPGQTVTVRAETPDSAGRTWRAEAHFRADSRGEVALGTSPSLGGSYTGVDPMGLVTSMDLTDAPGSAIYVPAGLAALPLHLFAHIDGRAIDSTTIRRTFLGPNVRVSELRTPGGPVGTLFLPASPRLAPGVVVLGGSEGGNSGVHVAAQLASHGYAALSLAYFAFPSLPPDIDEIPLEYFTRAITFLREQPGVDSTAIAVFGTSKGAEAALLVAAHDNRVRAVVAYAPSSVVWSCICPTSERSSWSLRGEGLPSVPPGRDPSVAPAPGELIRPVVHYRYRMRNASAVAGATIPVERINGPVLLVAGAADDLWPSDDMAREVRARLAASAGRVGDTLYVYPGAGHRIGKSYLPAGPTRIVGTRVETGGTPRANALAQADSWPRVLEFLAAHLRR